MSEQAGRSSLRVWHDEVRALAHVSIHNPPLGVLNQTVRRELGSFFLEAQDDASVRCIVFERLRRVELVDGSWKTAPNHSRPATCVVEADIDAEDQPEGDPQKGH